MSATYDLGDSIRLTFTVTDFAGVLTNATVVLTITKPDNTSSTPTVSTTGTGVYIATISPDQAGLWLYRWVATGAVTTAEDGQFTVEANASATLYTTVSEVREHLSDASNQLPTAQLEAKIRAASRWVDQHCGQKFWLDPAVTIRRYTPTEARNARIAPIGSSTGLVVKTDTGGDGAYATTWTAADYQLHPLDTNLVGTPYAWTQLVAVGTLLFPTWGPYPTLQVTARHGWSAIPDEIREATLLKAVALFKRKDAPFGIAGVSDFGPLRITRTDPDVLDLLRPFRLAGVA